MNNKGFAVTTVVYSVILLLSLVMISVLMVLRNEYGDQKTYVNDINEALTDCLMDESC